MQRKLTVLAMSIAFAVPAAATVVSDPERERIEQIVRDYILANPEIIPEAIEHYNANLMREVIAAHRTELETPFGAAWEGAADGDVVLVEFFDYSCAYCRQSREDLERLIEEDPGLRIVYRELPLLGSASMEAAKTSLAIGMAAGDDEYTTFHQILFGQGRPDEASLKEALIGSGVDSEAVARLRDHADIGREIERNSALFEAVQAHGTPTFVVGDTVLHGAVGYERLKEAIADARRSEGRGSKTMME